MTQERGTDREAQTDGAAPEEGVCGPYVQRSCQRGQSCGFLSGALTSCASENGDFPKAGSLERR